MNVYDRPRLNFGVQGYYGCARITGSVEATCRPIVWVWSLKVKYGSVTIANYQISTTLKEKLYTLSTDMISDHFWSVKCSVDFLESLMIAATTNKRSNIGTATYCSALYGWMDELGFYVPSTVFQSFRDDGRVNMKGSVQWSAVYVLEESRLQRDSNPRPRDPKSWALTARPRGRFISTWYMYILPVFKSIAYAIDALWGDIFKIYAVHFNATKLLKTQPIHTL